MTTKSEQISEMVKNISIECFYVNDNIYIEKYYWYAVIKTTENRRPHLGETRTFCGFSWIPSKVERMKGKFWETQYCVYWIPTSGHISFNDLIEAYINK
jgi:hypothetical protein